MQYPTTTTAIIPITTSLQTPITNNPSIKFCGGGKNF
jgi:hypothetical protein